MGYNHFFIKNVSVKLKILIKFYLGVVPHCIDSNTIISVIYKCFDGQNWESSFEADSTILSLSKIS